MYPHHDAILPHIIYQKYLFLVYSCMCVQIYLTFLNKGAINVLMTDSNFNILSILYMWLPSILGSRVDPSGSQNVSLTLTMTNGSKDTLGNKNSVPKVNGSSLAATLSSPCHMPMTACWGNFILAQCTKNSKNGKFSIVSPWHKG